MSRWTHVSGAVRLDDLSIVLPIKNTKGTIEKILGPISTFEEWNGDCRLPLGSEGSIEYVVHENPHEHSIARFDILFYGDLRNFDSSDLETIDNWFKKLLLEDFKSEITMLSIRDAVLKVECELAESYILYYQDNEIKKVELSNGEE